MITIAYLSVALMLIVAGLAALGVWQMVQRCCWPHGSGVKVYGSAAIWWARGPGCDIPNGLVTGVYCWAGGGVLMAGPYDLKTLCVSSWLRPLLVYRLRRHFSQCQVSDADTDAGETGAGRRIWRHAASTFFCWALSCWSRCLGRGWG